jgi:hypothetical protein
VGSEMCIRDSSLLTAMGIHVGGIKPNSIFDGCDLDLEGCPL